MKTFVVGLMIPVLAAGCRAESDGSRYRGEPVETREAGEEAPPDPMPAIPAPAAREAPAGVAAGAPAGTVAAETAPETATAKPAPRPEPPSFSPGPANAPTPAGEPVSFFFRRPEHVRGLYVNSWSAGSRRRLAALIDLARRTEVNSFVIDIKDATGYISHPTRVPLAREIGADRDIRIPSPSWLLGELEEAEIYPIARIVIVKDPVLAAARPHLAVQDTAGGIWADNSGTVWLNPFNREVWDYHIDLAREVAAMGFAEIQWDYVRFPDAPASVLGRARFPGREGRPRREAIREFLTLSREALAELDAEVTADVFGITTSATHDVGIGQVWESFIDVVDAALPMVYPSHYWKGAFGYDTPNSYPYEIVHRALADAVERSSNLEGAGATRPWLQDFTMGSPRYGAPEVRAQIQATYDTGIREWVLWNPGSRYTEAALEPVGGFAEEPLLRIANEIVPVSRRFEFLDTVTVQEEPETDTGAEATDSSLTPPAPDTARGGKGAARQGRPLPG